MTLAPAVENVEGAGTSVDKLMPPPPDVFALDPQAAAMLTKHIMILQLCYKG
ncbi:hypothetical protein JCGZ_23639 [Jatropha curcas]|uniref:Uncharacterized protein n=1 Tax=Jatropha curcas TaxID=180498 RepID=A0A067LF54_JATCU|nr:hypothetical protein JCGZ_23639 [Jatropha curcas]